MYGSALAIDYTISSPQDYSIPFWQTLPDKSSHFAKSILTRDAHTCQFCGFKSQKYQEIIAYKAEDWNLESVKTACIFCAQCMTLEKTALMRSGVLLFLPEVSQSQINRLAKILYVCRISQGSPADKTREVLDLLMTQRSRLRDKKLVLNKNGGGSDDLFNLIEQMNRCKTQEDYINLTTTLKGIRLFPLDRRTLKESGLEFNKFPQILAFWRSKDGPINVRPHEMNLSFLDRILNEGFTSETALWLDEALDNIY